MTILCALRDPPIGSPLRRVGQTSPFTGRKPPGVSDFFFPPPVFLGGFRQQTFFFQLTPKRFFFKFRPQTPPFGQTSGVFAFQNFAGTHNAKSRCAGPPPGPPWATTNPSKDFFAELGKFPAIAKPRKLSPFPRPGPPANIIPRHPGFFFSRCPGLFLWPVTPTAALKIGARLWANFLKLPPGPWPPANPAQTGHRLIRSPPPALRC